MNAKKIQLEVLKFLYSILVAFAFIIVFTVLLDLFCLVFLGGMKDPRPIQWKMLFFQKFPILTGTIRFFLGASVSYIICLTLAFGGMARALIGESRLPFFEKLEKKVQSDSQSAG